MTIVEDESFLEFIFFITHDLGCMNVVLPNRLQLRNEIVALAVYYRTRVKEDIQRYCVYYSMTSDIWTGRDGRSYISHTVHYLTEGFESRNRTLEVRELPGIHDGPAISAALNEMMKDWLLSKLYCTRFLRDGGSNMVSAAEKLGIEHMSCVAHTLHLVVAGALIKKKRRAGQSREMPAWAAQVGSENIESIVKHHEDEHLSEDDRENMEVLRELAIDEMDRYLDITILSLEHNELDSVREVVQHFRTLAIYFRKSPKGQNRLGEYQVRTRGIKRNEILRVQVDCPTRWNSCWDMLQRFIVLEESLVSFFAYLKSPEGRVEFEGMETKLWRPKSLAWLTIKCLTTLLAPLLVATTTLSGQEYPTMPLVVPILYGIRKHLSRPDLFAVHVAVAGEEFYVAETQVMMNDYRKIVLKLFNERFSVLENSQLKWVTYLDPRVGKRKSHLSAADKQSAADGLIGAANKLARECQGEPIHETPAQSTLQTSFPTSQVASGFMNDLFGPDELPEQRTSLDKDCADEVTLYLSDIKTVKSTQDPLLWWQVNCTKYFNLSRLTRKWLGTVVTSVPSERAFSTCGNILNVRRSSLAPSLVRDLVFIAHNWKVDHL